MGIFEKLWGDDGLHPSWGAQLEDILRHISQTFVHAQNYTLVDVPLFLEDESFRDKVLANLSPQIQDYWERSYNPRKDQVAYRASTLNKIRKFTDNELLYPILGQSQSTLDFTEAMQSSKIILASLPEGRIGDEAVTLIGSLIVGQLLQATLARVDLTQSSRLPYSLYCDEYYYFATNDFARFFAEGRKFRVSTVVAHQGRYQLDNVSKQATLNVANRIVFRVSGKNAQELSREFTYTPPKSAQFIVKRPLDVLLRKQHADRTISAFASSFAIIIDNLDSIFASKLQRLFRSSELTDALKDHANYLLNGLMNKSITFTSPAARQYVSEVMEAASWCYYQPLTSLDFLIPEAQSLFDDFDKLVNREYFTDTTRCF